MADPTDRGSQHRHGRQLPSVRRRRLPRARRTTAGPQRAWPLRAGSRAARSSTARPRPCGRDHLRDVFAAILEKPLQFDFGRDAPSRARHLSDLATDLDRRCTRASRRRRGRPCAAAARAARAECACRGAGFTGTATPSSSAGPDGGPCPRRIRAIGGTSRHTRPCRVRGQSTERMSCSTQRCRRTLTGWWPTDCTTTVIRWAVPRRASCMYSRFVPSTQSRRR